MLLTRSLGETLKSVLFCHSHKTSSSFLLLVFVSFWQPKVKHTRLKLQNASFSPSSHSSSVQSRHGNSRQDTPNANHTCDQKQQLVFKYRSVSQTTLHLWLHSYNLHATVLTPGNIHDSKASTGKSVGHQLSSVSKLRKKIPRFISASNSSFKLIFT